MGGQAHVLLESVDVCLPPMTDPAAISLPRGVATFGAPRRSGHGLEYVVGRAERIYYCHLSSQIAVPLLLVRVFRPPAASEEPSLVHGWRGDQSGISGRVDRQLRRARPESRAQGHRHRVVWRN
jgi:hypothetical protein